MNRKHQELELGSVCTVRKGPCPRQTRISCTMKTMQNNRKIAAPKLDQALLVTTCYNTVAEVQVRPCDLLVLCHQLSTSHVCRSVNTPLCWSITRCAVNPISLGTCHHVFCFHRIIDVVHKYIHPWRSSLNMPTDQWLHHGPNDVQPMIGSPLASGLFPPVDFPTKKQSHTSRSSDGSPAWGFPVSPHVSWSKKTIPDHPGS